jgi:hypothetical protein
MLIVGTASGRPEYLQATLESWRGVVEVCTAEMVWFLEPERTQEMVDVLEHAKNHLPCSIEWHVNAERLGVVGNPKQALLHAFDRGEPYVLLIEDDVMVGEDVLQMHEWARYKYEYDDEILVVCSNALGKGEVDPCLARDVYRDKAFSASGWGTWLDRLPRILSVFHDWEGKSWDHSLWQQLLMSDKFKAIAPYWSRSKHVGEHGEHCEPAIFESTVTDAFVGDLPGKPVEGWKEIPL